MTLKELLGDSYKDGMSLEEIDKALAVVQLPTDESSRKEIDRLTKALSKSNSEAAENKRKLQEKQTEEEKREEERAQQLKELTEELATLKAEKATADYKAQFLALGYDDSLASDTATAMVAGDMAKVFANQKAHQEAQKKQLEAELLKKTPTPPAGDGTDTITKEKYRAMSLDEKQKLARENPTLYNKLNSEE